MDYLKDFNKWNNEKQRVHKKHSLHVKKWEIWLCKLWINIWHEADGKNDFLRPVLILQIWWNIALIAPMTTNQRRIIHKRYHQIQSINFWTDTAWQMIISLVMLTQIKTIDSRRCFRYKCKIQKNELKLILNKTISLIWEKWI